jgi:hypothetical protein
MALAAPPHSELHPMRVLFIIPKDPPPRLEGAFSDAFKDFVAACLQVGITGGRRPHDQHWLGGTRCHGPVAANINQRACVVLCVKPF